MMVSDCPSNQYIGPNSQSKHDAQPRENVLMSPPLRTRVLTLDVCHIPQNVKIARSFPYLDLRFLRVLSHFRASVDMGERFKRRTMWNREGHSATVAADNTTHLHFTQAIYSFVHSINHNDFSSQSQLPSPRHKRVTFVFSCLSV